MYVFPERTGISGTPDFTGRDKTNTAALRVSRIPQLPKISKNYSPFLG